MPRKPRIDIPGVYQHVMARGIDGIKIYRSKKDYERFLSILSEILLSTGDTFIMAWALMSNHFHLLIFINKTPLSSLMRRLLTKYALYFNGKYKRRGHLFQNRYKSIVCQEDQYLLHLVRYIHLNPYQADATKTIEDLDECEYTGHRALLGKTSRPWQKTEEILKYFSYDHNKYREFIKSEMLDQRNIGLDDGGLFKSIKAAGEELQKFQVSTRTHKERFDERILGRGDFVDQVLNEIGNNDDKYCSQIPLEQIIDKGVQDHEVTKDFLVLKNSKAMGIKADIIRESVLIHKHKASDVSKALGLNRSNVSRILARMPHA